MPRPLRIEYSGAWYHVMNRGINHMDIYSNDIHREIFINLLKEVSALFEIRIHGYCLMDNHYHLLLQTQHPNLGKAMRQLNGVYTQRYNHSEQRDGALKENYPRLLAIYLARNFTLLSHQEISRYFVGIETKSVSGRLYKCKKLIEKNSDIEMHYQNLINMLRSEF